MQQPTRTSTVWKGATGKREFEDAPMQSSSQPHHDSDGMPSGTETILLVEDDPDVLRLTTVWLRNFGYNVLQATGGLEALRILDESKEPIHLLLADVIMPHMSGPQLAEQVRRRNPQTRILFMSGYARDDTPIRLGAAQPPPMLVKPFEISTLLKKVREALGC